MAGQIISESEVGLLRMLFGGANRPNIKARVSSSLMGVMGRGSTGKPVDLDGPKGMLSLPEWAGSTISLTQDTPACL